MRFCLPVVAIVVAVFFTSIGGSSPKLARSVIVGEHNVPGIRFLKTENAVGVDDEARGFINIKSSALLEKLKSSSAVKQLAKATKLFKSKQVTLDNLMKWAKQEKSMDYVFSKMTLNKAGDQLFKNSDFPVWVAYTRMVTKNDPDGAIMAFLKSRYDEDVLEKMMLTAIASSKDSKRTIDFSSDVVFTTLKLGKNKDGVFTNPGFLAWVDYTRMVLKSDPDRAIFFTLRREYSDVAQMMKQIETATKNAATKDLATALQKMQVDDWKKFDVSTDKVFTALKLDKNVDGLLTNPNLNVWSTYVEAVAGKNNKLKTPMIDIFRAHYKDADLLRVFKAAQENPQTKRMGENLEMTLQNIYRLKKLGKAN